MENLEILLAGPVNQMVLVKTTKPLTMEGMNGTESVTVYSKKLSSHIQNLHQHLPEKNAEIVRLKSQGNDEIEKMDELLCKLLWVQLQSIGIFTNTNTLPTSLSKQIGLNNFYDRWLEETISVLINYRYLKRDGESLSIVTTPIDRVEAWKEWDSRKQSWLDDPNLKARVMIAEAALQALPDILTGKRLATEVLFPNSSMDLVGGIYKNNQTSDFFNEVIADAVVAAILERLKLDASARIRILEIGAGTGGTSSMVLRKIKPYQAHIEEYCYTDISKSFLLHAEREYGPEHPYLTYQIFNVEEPIASQGIRAGGYDIVIATNVLHATKNIRRTLRNAKATIKPNGLLMLNELCSNTLIGHITFGLLEGWWLYEDALLRIPGCPALYPETWQEVLIREGFRSVLFPVQEAHELGKQIIIAESDGVVRQKRELQPEATPFIKRVVPIKAQMPLTGQKPAVTSANEVTEELLRKKSTLFMKKLVSETLKVPISKIDSSEPLERYGIDSILVVQLTNTLRKVLDNVTSTLFFECQTIDALVEHFLQTQKASLMKLVGLDFQESLETKESAAEPSMTVHTKSVVRKVSRFSHVPGRVIEDSPSVSSNCQDIAIIGLAGRYPKAKDITEFWNNLKAGRNCISEIPGDRWDWKEYFGEEKGKWGTIYTKWGGFMEDIDKFDPLFFQISPAEAERMDPQERLFLQVAYASIEDAGYTPATLGESRKIGVYVGVMNGHYPVGAGYWSIANRVSYLFNFQGPSMAVDTACSSSLTAIHLAVESLQSGMCECAIAGGVNVIVDPVHYMKLTAATMLSESNQCRAFGDQADGFIDGEGVGAIVLKPLQKAIADGDHIYGVIKGSMINAGGKTNGYTVPNPHAQSQLIAEAFQRAGVHPRTVTYIEAHGTGTALGDPIEVAGLTRAFEQQTNDKQFCAIGSVKSNIGHCESAAGIAGVTKVLLQLKHRQLVPSLHAKKPNPHIEFCNTPFKIQQELAEWKRPIVELNGVSKEYPRISGISSFGAGGANAHIIIAEYIPDESAARHVKLSPQNPAIIVLSAKNEERLREQARQFLDAIQEQQWSDEHLADIAYTLQVGRVAMEERLAFTVVSIKELEEKLRAFLNEQDETGELYRGQVKNYKGMLEVFAADDDLAKCIDAWIAKRKYAKLLDLWVKGFDFDWDKLYGDLKPRRMSLPTYPFAKERYWFDTSKSPNAAIGKNAVSSELVVPAIHPLVHTNTSDLTEQRFTSTFTGQEFFLADHVVNGQRFLPGVAHLEMARVAVAQATGGEQDHPIGIKIKNMAWVRPVEVQEQPIQVHIGLFPEENGELSFEIYSRPKQQGHDPLIHSQGYAELCVSQEMERLDLMALQSRCNRRTLSANECYEAFQSMGLIYGPGLQALEKVYVGEGQLLAKLSLPFSVRRTRDQFVLHPSMMDAALQASVVAGVVEGTVKKSLPFALQELEIMGCCTPDMWVYVQYRTAGDMIQTCDIDLCDGQGNVCARMKGYASRVVEKEDGPDDHLGDEETLMLFPVWKEENVSQSAIAPDYAQHLVFLCELDESVQWGIEEQMSGVRSISLHSSRNNIDARFQAYATQVFEEIKRMITDKPKGKMLVQIVVSSQEEQYLFSGLSGLLQTARKENPAFVGQLILVEPGEDQAKIMEKLVENSRTPMASLIRYQDGKRWVAGWNEVESSPEEDINLPWKDGGIYLITGGLGGLGMIFAREIAQKVKNAVLILTGRSLPNREKVAQLRELEEMGTLVEYRQIDVSDRQEVTALIQGILQEYGRLDGIIHSAGVIRDNFILKKTVQEMEEVLAPKVRGLVNLDLASKDLPLDFFILFSSGVGAKGNVGQADYAVANAFLDAYAKYRNSLVASRQRQGKTLSINWPLWKEGGMQVDHETEKMMRQTTGMTAMQTSTGIQALYQALASGKDQVMVMVGELERLKQAVKVEPHQHRPLNDGWEHDETERYDDEFYRNLSERIYKGELSEEEFEEIMRISGIGGSNG
ncbi:type I polyketide synthase [Thermoflavimicrobium dichotomicum]